MKKNLKQFIRDTIIKELLVLEYTGPFVSGNPSFQGTGNYGFGGTRQLATNLNPATQNIEDQEQEELNQNIEDQQWNLRKFRWVKGEPFQDIGGRPEDERDMQSILDVNPEKKRLKRQRQLEEPEELHERNVSDQFYSHLPGNYRENVIEDPIDFVPGVGRPDGTDEYLIDDIVDEIEEKTLEKLQRESSNAWAAPAQEEREIGHMAMSPAKHTPGPGGYGLVSFHKDFVPEEWPQESDMEDEDMDGIPDDVDLNRRQKEFY